MSRASTSMLGAVAKSVTPNLARSFRTIPGARPPKAASAGPAVDYRIFQGIDGFLGEKEFSRLNEWQGGLWERLQAEVNNNPRLAEIKQKWDRSGLDMADLLTTSSRDPQLSLAFNYASLLMNNSFFLEGLHRDNAKPIPSEFRALEEKVSNYANGITGGGWLWLVRSNSSQLDVDIVPTFAAGTLLVSNRSQRGRNDTAELYLEPEASAPESTQVPEPEPEIASDPNSPTEVPPTLSLPPASSFSRASRRSENTWPIPLAVLNLYELAYMGEKYGVWGKKQYAADWWKSLNWEEIVRRNAKAQ